MFKGLLIASFGALALSAAALPQAALAQSGGRDGFGGMGQGGSEEFRMHGGGHGGFGGGGQMGGGRGQFGGGRGQFGGMGQGGSEEFRMHGGGHGQFAGGQLGGAGSRFHNDYRPFGGTEMERHRGGEFRFQGERGRFGAGQDFRFRQEHRNFGYAERFRRPVREHFGYGERFRVGRTLEYRHGFERPSVGYRYRVGAARPYLIHRPFVREGGFGVRYVRPYPVRVGYGFPGAGCTVRRNVSLTPFGWRKIVTVRICYVR